MSEVVVVARFVARAGMEERAEAVVSALVEPTHSEDGCLLYALHRSVDQPVMFTFVERWSSAQDLDAHSAREHVRSLLGQVDDLFSSWDVTVLESMPLGDPGKGSLAGAAR